MIRTAIATLLAATFAACGGGGSANNSDVGVAPPDVVAPQVFNDTALRGKRMYLDGGRIVGTGVSCVDCHGDAVGSAFSLGKAANNPSAIDYAINAIPQMARSRGRYSAQDLIDIAAFIGTPNVASPDLRVLTSGAAANQYNSGRLEFGALSVGAKSSISTVRFVNVGQIALKVTSMPTLAGPDAAQFELRSTDCQAGLSLQTQQSCELTVVFSPVGLPGLRSASVGIGHDWVRAAENIALIGTAAL